METFHAIFENGVFRPTAPVPFPDKSEVKIEAELVKDELVQDLDAIYAVMSQRHNTGERDLAERHNEHQP